MIAYEKLPLDNEVKAALEGLEIEYVFQPIFYKDCVRIYAYEALMRPKKMTVGQLIDEFARMRNCIYWKLPLFLVQHRRILSGDIRNISVSILSRRKVLRRMRQKHLILILEQKGKRIIEILEYPKVSLREWVRKK